MAQSHRMQKVEREVREILSMELVRAHTTQLKGMVTISKVIVSADLRQAKIYISQFGDQGELNQDHVKHNLTYLAEVAYQLQEVLGRRLAMKFTPKLKFFFDEAYYAGIAIENQIRQMQKAREEGQVLSSQEPSDLESHLSNEAEKPTSSQDED